MAPTVRHIKDLLILLGAMIYSTNNIFYKKWQNYSNKST